MDKKLTADDVRKIVAEKGLKYIRLQFVDIFGTMKNIAIPSTELDKALDNKMMFDGSSIEGFVRIEESDMYLRPDPSTFVIMPWFNEQGGIGRMICDIYRPDGTPFEGDPRYILRRAIKRCNDMGFNFYVGPEMEFFLFQLDKEGKPSTVTTDEAGYFDLAPIDNGEVARIDMVRTLIEMGFKVEAAHHENSPGQHEIDFTYSDALNAADNIVTFKMVVKMIAKTHGLHATFMPKPLSGLCGSGMHCNMSLFKDGKNAFYDPNGKAELSDMAYNFMAGLLKHAKGMAAITNPLVNSYKRLVSGFEAPVYIAWSMSNRSPLIRVPGVRGNGSRLELRNPDPSCNPYLALALMLHAGLDGIEGEMNPPEPIGRNIYHMSDKDLEKSGIERLPKDLKEAMDCLHEDQLLKDALGEHVLENYTKAKNIEWQEYTTLVHPWEVSKYIVQY
ncbi:type I glutamate--ammonia ligase [Tyzzerella sp. OttesenSCG-928-J15]|nr:type I glutamate--ammonia ligase [Tyzzerella sp. OttesenSCG-928-J15]